MRQAVPPRMLSSGLPALPAGQLSSERRREARRGGRRLTPRKLPTRSWAAPSRSNIAGRTAVVVEPGDRSRRQAAAAAARAAFAYRGRIFATTRLNRPGVAGGASWSAEAGAMDGAASITGVGSFSLCPSAIDGALSTTGVGSFSLCPSAMDGAVSISGVRILLLALPICNRWCRVHHRHGLFLARPFCDGRCPVHHRRGLLLAIPICNRWCRVHHRRGLCNGWCRRHRGGLRIASGEDQTPFHVMTCRTLESAPLEARDRHGVVLDNLYQVHFSVAGQTMHHSLPTSATHPSLVVIITGHAVSI